MVTPTRRDFVLGAGQAGQALRMVDSVHNGNLPPPTTQVYQSVQPMRISHVFSPPFRTSSQLASAAGTRSCKKLQFGFLDETDPPSNVKNRSYHLPNPFTYSWCQCRCSYSIEGRKINTGRVQIFRLMIGSGFPFGGSDLHDDGTAHVACS